MNSDNALAIASYIGYLFGGYCGMVGAYVVLRWGITGVTSIWARRQDIDRVVESDLKIKIGRD
jgi:hypothetical protein